MVGNDSGRWEKAGGAARVFAATRRAQVLPRRRGVDARWSARVKEMRAWRGNVAVCENVNVAKWAGKLSQPV